MAIIQSTQTHPKFTPHFPVLNSSDSKSALSLRRPVNKKLLTEAQSWVKNIPGTWIWKLAVHKAKEAYGIIEPEPYPEVGDTRDNFVCTYSNPAAGEYIFSRKGSVVRHA